MNINQWKRYIAHSIRRYIEEEVSGQAAPIRIPSYWTREHMRKFRPSSGSLRDANKILDHPPINGFDLDSVSSIKTTDLDPEDVRLVRDSVARLTERQRTVIKELFGIGGETWTIKDVAKRNRTTYQAVRDRKYAAFKILKVWLESLA